MWGRRVFHVLGRDGVIFLPSEGEIGLEEVGERGWVVELERTQAERGGVDL